jgi:hypothetical protein
MTRPCALVGAAALVGLLATSAQATPIIEQTLVATGGDVVVTFVSNGAGFTSELFLDGALGDEIGTIFNNWTTNLGTSMNLGTFEEGTELVFKLLVQQTGDLFYTGDGSRNLDGMVHAVIENLAGQVLVGFEDILGGGDLDYNDLVFAFTNVTAEDTPGAGVGGTTGSATVDEPSTLLLLGTGLAMLGIAMRRPSVRR